MVSAYLPRLKLIMDINQFYMFSLVLLNLSTFSVWAQTTEIDAVHGASSSLNQFALNLLAQTASQAGDEINLAISPYTVWSLMSIIAEGARENTARQLEDVLKIPPIDQKDGFRRSYKSLTKYLLQSPSKDVELNISSAIFTTKDQELNRNYQTTTKNFYGVDVTPVDFSNLVSTTNLINKYVADATQNKIQNFVKIDDIIDAQILMVTTLFFKGQWKTPFNKTATFKDAFIDQSGKAKGQVNMMYQIAPFPYSNLIELKGHAVELPYGNDDRLSMIALLPYKGQPINAFLKRLASKPFSHVLEALATSALQYPDSNVEVFLPRFTVDSDLNLNAVLDQMGITDVFDQERANLLGIFPHYLYVSRIIQQAKIEVNEEGTVASSAAGGAIADKISEPRFYANRDFVYFIVDKLTKSIIFSGKITNPNTICDACSKKSK